MKQAWSLMGSIAAVAALAACAQTGGVVPVGQPGREPMTLRAIPIYTPAPTPTPDPPGRHSMTLRAIPIYSPSPSPSPTPRRA